MHKLYLTLQGCPEPPTEDEIAIASRKKILDPNAADAYLQKLQHAQTGIAELFNQQRLRSAVHRTFHSKLYASIDLATDRKRFGIKGNSRSYSPSGWLRRISHLMSLLEYTHTRGQPLHIPHRHALRKHIMKMGEDSVEGIKKMIAVSNLSSLLKFVLPLTRYHRTQTAR